MRLTNSLGYVALRQAHWERRAPVRSVVFALMK
jgi:hypothetical protein